jgi:signal transduction histidine kinase/CheY-like chemotaxis protein
VDRAIGWNNWRFRSIDTAMWVGMSTYTLLVIARRTFLTLNSVAAIWPAAGIMAAAFLLSRKGSWKWIVLIAVGENVAANGLFGFSPRTLLSIPEAMLLAWLIRRACPPSLNFAEPRTLVRFLTLALIPACLASSAAMYFLPGSQPPNLHSSASWFIGHSLGGAIAVPTMVTLLRPRRYRVFQRPAWELVASCGAMAAYVAVLFAGHSPVMPLLVFPMAMFIAFRYGPVGASVVSMLMMIMALTHIYTNAFWPRLDGYDQVQWVQFLVAVVFLTSLPAAGALASLRRTRRLLARRTETARLARRRADAAAQAKSEFLANMSHEIRTPLNGVIGLADALSRTTLARDQQEMLGMILGSGRVLNNLLSDALDLARADSGALKLSPEPFDVREAIGGSSYPFESIAREKGVGFQVEFDIRHRGPVLGDSLRIRQIVSNLINNAVKFTSTGKVEVRVLLIPVGASASELSVTVCDTGPGFDEAVKARLFTRFEQGDSQTARRFGGTGLGLAISRRLADMMDATIDCEATPGVGASFTFRLVLPMLADAGEAAPMAPAIDLSPAPGERRLRVLLAEDHPVNQRVVQAILSSSCDLTIVGDGQAAIDAFTTQTFDAILMDSQMPVLDGLAAIRAIRAQEAARALPRTPILSLTADALPQQVRASLAAGADRHLAKPVTTHSLLQALASALRREAA